MNKSKTYAMPSTRVILNYPKQRRVNASCPWILDLDTQLRTCISTFQAPICNKTQAQKDGQGYKSATGELFANEGKIMVPCRTQEGHRRDITDQHSTKVSIAFSDNPFTWRKPSCTACRLLITSRMGA